MSECVSERADAYVHEYNVSPSRVRTCGKEVKSVRDGETETETQTETETETQTETEKEICIVRERGTTPPSR